MEKRNRPVSEVCGVRSSISVIVGHLSRTRLDCRGGSDPDRNGKRDNRKGEGGMTRGGFWGRVGAILLCAIGAFGCAPQSTSTTSDTAAMSARKVAISKQFQNDWIRCVNASFQVTQHQTPDKNAAAERAFASCATEESQMNSLYDPSINALVMPHFMAEAKRLLVEKGQIDTSP